MVSLYAERDLVKLNVFGNQYFRYEDGQIMASNNSIATRSIVPQMSPEAAKKIEFFTNTIK